MRPPDIARLVLGHGRAITVAALVAVTLIAAVYTVLGVGMTMSALDMTALAGGGGRSSGMSGMSGMAALSAIALAPPDWTLAYAVAVASMWWIMMVAMMTPSAAPVLLLYDALRARLGRPRTAPVAAFAGGYLTAWLGFSLAATALQWRLEREGLVSPSTMALSGHLLGGTVLLVAGLWQLTPAKHACLSRCRHPARVLAGRIDGGPADAFRTGAEHGAYCVGCCWALMALLFFGGIMNLWWVLGLASLVLVEKLWARGEVFARAVGAVLIVAGAAVLAGAG